MRSAAVLLVTGLFLSGCAATPQPGAASSDGPVGAAATGTPPPGASATRIQVSDVSLVASAVGSTIKVYGAEGDTSAERTLRNPLPSGAPLVFLVQERRGDWLRVLLAVRPNESQGWVRASDVKLSRHDFRITVSTGRHEITVYRSGAVLMRAPVGLGKESTPTPGGVFYTKELLKPPDPNGSYGPYAYGLSGFSEVLDEFLGGDGEIGIHGTNDPASVGGAVSHGCIRMRNADITKLVTMLPLGVPVQIIA